MDSTDIRDTVLAELPPVVLKLLAKIEKYAKKQIQFHHSEKFPSETNPNPEAPFASVDHKRAIIYIPKISPDLPKAIVHELLHIERYWVEAVPQIVPISNESANWTITSGIENSLEHQIIIPLEATYGFDTSEYWNMISRKNWGRYPWPEMSSEFARKRNCLLGWLGCNLVADTKVVNYAKSCVQKEGLFKEANRFRKGIERFRNNKIKALAFTIRALKIPRNEAQLVVYDPIREEKRTKKIPIF